MVLTFGTFLVVLYLAYLLAGAGWADRALALRLRVLQLMTLDSQPVELMSAFMLLSWALILCLPGSTFSSSPGYRMLMHIAPEDGWGLVAGAIGVMQFYAVFLNTRRVRKITALAATAFWAFVATLIALANPHSTGGGVYTIVMLGNIWAYNRILCHQCYLRRKTDFPQR